MQLTKFGHACIRLDQDERRLVIDPGGLTAPGALDGAQAVLVTHEHFDHFSEATLREAAAANPELEIWTNSSVAAKLDGLGTRVHAVGDGQTFTAAGFDVKVHGTWHAIIHPDIPRVGNVGFLVEDTLFHPGDALTVPGQQIDTLLLPIYAPWSTVGHLIDYVREVAPKRALAVHDGAVNDAGVGMLGGLLGPNGPGLGGAPYIRLIAGESVPVT